MTAPQLFRPFSEYFKASERSQMPAEMQRSIAPIEISLSPLAGQAPTFRSFAAWADDWWFTLIEGNGVAHSRGDIAEQADNYVLLAQWLSGKNRPGGTLASFPQAGEMVLMPWRAKGALISAGQFKYLLVFVPKAALFDVAAPGADLPFHRPISTTAGSGAILSSLLRTMVNEAGRSSSRADAANALPALARLIVDAFDKAEPIDVGRSTYGERRDRVVAYLKDHLSLPGMSAQQAADACGLSKRELFRAFAKAGQSFASLLWELRVERARDLLAFRPDLSIAEVARSTGFSSSSHLGRIFRSALEMSPRHYRIANAPSRAPLSS